jgi:O-antigen ligase
MTHETYGRVSATSLIADTFNDLSDLLRKEMRLASAEMSNAVTTGIRASVMMAVGGAFLLMALLLALGGLVLVLALYGFPLHVASFIVAGGLAVVGLILVFYARAQMRADKLAPARSASQLREALQTAREHMK